MKESVCDLNTIACSEQDQHKEISSYSEMALTSERYSVGLQHDMSAYCTRPCLLIAAIGSSLITQLVIKVARYFTKLSGSASC